MYRRRTMTPSDATGRTVAPADAPQELRALMEAYVDGDERAFGRLHTVLEPRVRGRLVRIVHNPTLVDDLVQLTFLRAHAARERFSFEAEPDDRAVEGWYLAIARNVALDHLRQAYRRDRRHERMVARGEVAALGIPDADLNAEEASVMVESQDEVTQLVREAIDRLPENQAEVVRLHKLGGLSMADASEKLGVRPGALRVRAHRAYRALAAALRGVRPELGTA
jgi:RNA polymerase sigma-70 factor, ECF subfamily